MYLTCQHFNHFSANLRDVQWIFMVEDDTETSWLAEAFLF